MVPEQIPSPESINDMRRFFESGATRPLDYRLRLIEKLRVALKRFEPEIYAALHADLSKSAEEAYATELGLVLAELHYVSRHLSRWMKPRRVKTNLVNFPSSSKIYREPLGLVLVIAPWNYPFQLSLIPLIGALAAGNNVVLKPSEMAGATAILLEKILREVFEPEQVLVAQGNGARVIPQLMQLTRFDHIFFTGGTVVGKKIYESAAKDLIPVTLELGGKSPAIVEADADLTISAKRIALAKFANAGQTCVAPDYVLVHESVAGSFTREMEKCIRSFFGEDPKISPYFGRIINERQFDRLTHLLEGQDILYGGNTDRAAKYISPTLIRNPSPDADIMKEEIFGPILPIISFREKQEALDIIRKNPNPLSFYVFTSAIHKEKDWLHQVPFGNGCVNNAAWQFANHHLPFGGIGQSGLGAYHGKYSFDLFTHPKAILKTPVWPDMALRYPPFTGRLGWFKKLIR